MNYNRWPLLPSLLLSLPPLSFPPPSSLPLPHLFPFSCELNVYHVPNIDAKDTVLGR